jgi:hypothetical protein
MTIKAIASCRGDHAVRLVNPLTYSAGVDVAGSPSPSQTEPPSGWRRAIQIQPLPNLNATIDREAWVLDEKNLGFVNFVGNRQCITLENLAEIANAHTAISRGRRCHLSQLNVRERCRPSNVELCCHRVTRDFFAEAGISKN